MSPPIKYDDLPYMGPFGKWVAKDVPPRTPCPWWSDAPLEPGDLDEYEELRVVVSIIDAIKNKMIDQRTLEV